MAIGVLVAVALLAGPAGAVKETDSIRDARDKREVAKGQAAEAAEALVLVEAADDEVSDALHALDDAVALQEAKILAARQAIEAAEAEATLRWVQADEIAADLALMVVNGADDVALFDALSAAVGQRIGDGTLAVLFASLRMVAGPWMPPPDDESP